MDGKGKWQLNSDVRTLLAPLAAIFSIYCGGSIFAQNLALPPRRAGALEGDAFAQKISTMDLGARNRTIADEYLAGNVPNLLRKLCPVTVTNVSDGVTNVATFFVAPDYLAIGSDTNYFFAAISPDTAQRIAVSLDCTLPTRKMVDAIYAAAQVKLAPSPIPPTAAMTTVPVFIEHNKTVWAQRMALTNSFPLGALVAGDKKDVVISRRLTVATNNVAIYGWHRLTNGVAIAIQPLYLGHAWSWVDYSQGVRLISRTMLVNGKVQSVADVLADPKLYGLISDEGVVTNAQYSTNFSWPDRLIELKRKKEKGEGRSGDRLSPQEVNARAAGDEASPLQFKTLDGVRIVIDAPPESFSTDRPVELVFYALPNGNTIEETMGKKLSPNDDWHFDLQHIGAQTRWLRQVVTNKTIVMAYLEANTKSWPGWRKTHFDSDRRIAQLLNEVIDMFAVASNLTEPEVVLASHSGGGSLVFGYLNSVNEIPARVRRIAFLDSDYGYDSALHAAKVLNWLRASEDNRLCVLAYQDYLGLYNGKPFVSQAGGTWGRSWAMLNDLGRSGDSLSPQMIKATASGDEPSPFRFSFTSETNSELEIYTTTNRQIEFLLKENPDHKILHTVQVERNGFIQALLSGTELEGQGYEYLGKLAYTNWIR